MIEITIAQAIISALALIVATIIIAQPFRKKVVNCKHRSISFGFAPAIMDTSKPIGHLKNVHLEKGSIVGEFVPAIKQRKSRAGEIRKPSTLPKNASEEEKRKLKNRLRSRAYRAKKRAELNK